MPIDALFSFERQSFILGKSNCFFFSLWQIPNFYFKNPGSNTLFFQYRLHRKLKEFLSYRSQNNGKPVLPNFYINRHYDRYVTKVSMPLHRHLVLVLSQMSRNIVYNSEPIPTSSAFESLFYLPFIMVTSTITQVCIPQTLPR